MKKSDILTTSASVGYELIDSGEEEKLERFGKFVLSRPDPQALWRKRLDSEEWKKADAFFSRDDKGGDWVMKKGIENRWPINFGNLKFWIKPTVFKHVGIFPEQAANWDWLRECISKFVNAPYPRRVRTHPLPKRNEVTESVAKEEPLLGLGRWQASSGDVSSLSSSAEVLNLFAYTGGATLACAQAGAKVVHIDGSKTALTWARENAELSGLQRKSIRWILEDARAFARRELKRGRKYHGIIMDPPAFGHGPDGEIWKIEDDFLPLIESCFELLADKPLFFLINGYASGYSAITYENNLSRLAKKCGGKVESGELTIRESEIANHESRLLPCGIFARWSAGI
jgi:23S rRNA (cytosine1962-C5)-methyltransferase